MSHTPTPWHKPLLGQIKWGGMDRPLEEPMNGNQVAASMKAKARDTKCEEKQRALFNKLVSALESIAEDRAVSAPELQNIARAALAKVSK